MHFENYIYERFQPTSPVRETTGRPQSQRQNQYISTHVPRAGDDDLFAVYEITATGFQPTSPVRETTFYNSSDQIACRISTHVPRAGDDFKAIAKTLAVNISTHVPRAGDDQRWGVSLSGVSYFNPRPPCGRRLFFAVSLIMIRCYFNPRPPCGRRPLMYLDEFDHWVFQPTSPVRETTTCPVPALLSGVFQPTSPVRETTLV